MSRAVDGIKKGGEAAVGKFGDIFVGVIQEVNDVTGASLCTISGPKPDESELVTTTEAEGRNLSIRSEPEPSVPVPDAVTMAVHIW